MLNTRRIVLFIAAFVLGAVLMLLRGSPMQQKADEGSSIAPSATTTVKSLPEIGAYDPSRPPSTSVLITLLDRKLSLEERLPDDIEARVPRNLPADDIPALLMLVGDNTENDSVRNVAANLLSRSQTPSFAPSLSRVLDNPAEGPRFRAFATQHLGQLARRPALTQTATIRLRDCLQDRDIEVRREALLALIELRDGVAQKTALEWLDAKGPKYDALRPIAIRAVQELGLAETIPIFRMYASSEDEPTCIAALVALSEMNDGDSRILFEEATRSRSVRIQRTGRIALDRALPDLESVCPRADRTVDLLIPALMHQSQKIRDQAVLALKPFGSRVKPAVTAVIEALSRRDGTGDNRLPGAYLEVVKAAGKAETKEIEALANLLSERSLLYRNKAKKDVHQLRAFILVTLAEMGAAPSAVVSMLDYLNNEEDGMQYAYAAAAHALARLGQPVPDAVPLLTRALKPGFVDDPLSFSAFPGQPVAISEWTSPRKEAVRALKASGSSALHAVPALEALLDPANPAERLDVPMQEEIQAALVAIRK